MDINLHNQEQLSLIRSRYLFTKNLLQSKLIDYPEQKAVIHKELLIFGYSAVYVMNDMISKDITISTQHTEILMFRFEEIDQKILLLVEPVNALVVK